MRTDKYTNFELDVKVTCNQRRFVWKSDGTYGLGSGCMRAGDIIVVLRGGLTPYALHPRGNEFLFFGQAYVDEIMHGELMEQLRGGKVEERCFCSI